MMYIGNIINIIRSQYDVSHPAKPSPFRTESLQPGDILIKLTDSTPVNRLISYGQSFAGGSHSLWTHAGLATSSSMMAEMSDDGLEVHNLAGQNSGYVYDVFRCKYRQVALGACEANSTLLKQGKRVAYNHGGAVISLLPGSKDKGIGRMEKALKQMETGTYKLFCSEHVVFCYLVSLEKNNKVFIAEEFPKLSLRMQDFFDKDPEGYSPAYLHECLQRNKYFDYMGRWNRMKWSN